MPFYEYECPSCDTRFDLLAKMDRADDAVCSRCGAKARRLLSVIGGMTGRATAPAPTCGGGACGNC